MIEEFDWSPEMAVAAFVKVRQPGTPGVMKHCLRAEGLNLRKRKMSIDIEDLPPFKHSWLSGIVQVQGVMQDLRRVGVRPSRVVLTH